MNILAYNEKHFNWVDCLWNRCFPGDPPWRSTLAIHHAIGQLSRSPQSLHLEASWVVIRLLLQKLWAEK